MLQAPSFHCLAVSNTKQLLVRPKTPFLHALVGSSCVPDLRHQLRTGRLPLDALAAETLSDRRIGRTSAVQLPPQLVTAERIAALQVPDISKH